MPNKPKPTTWHPPMALPSVKFNSPASSYTFHGKKAPNNPKPTTWHPPMSNPPKPITTYGKAPFNTPGAFMGLPGSAVNNYNTGNTNTGKSSWDKFMKELEGKWSNPNAGWYGITAEPNEYGEYSMYGLQTHPSTWEGGKLQEAKYYDPDYGKGGLAVNQGSKWTAEKSKFKRYGGGFSKFKPMPGIKANNGGYAVDPGTFLPGVTNPEDKPIEWSEAITQQDEYHKYMQQYMNQLYGAEQGPIMYQRWFENQYGVAAEEDPLAQQKAYDEWMKGQLSPEEYKEWSENYYGYEPDEDPLEQQKAYDEWMKGQLTPEQYAEWSENYYGYEGEPVSDEVKLMDDMRKYLIEQYGEVEGMKQYNKWMTRNYKGLGNTYAQSTSGMGAGMVNWRT